jgi:hypothetical protein
LFAALAALWLTFLVLTSSLSHPAHLLLLMYESPTDQHKHKPHLTTPADGHQHPVTAYKPQGVHDYSTFADKKRPSGLGRLKRKKPHLVERGIRPERTAEKNARHIWKLDVLEEPRPAWPPVAGAGACGGGGGGGGGGEGGGAQAAPGLLGSGRVRVEVAGNGFLYR